jgi:hypothetical protein
MRKSCAALATKSSAVRLTCFPGFEERILICLDQREPVQARSDSAVGFGPLRPSHPLR